MSHPGTKSTPQVVNGTETTFQQETPTSSKILALPRTVLSILVVDENRSDRQLYAMMLDRDPTTQYKLEECASGAEAIAWVRKETPDCILLDYQLPDGSAVDLLDQLSKIVDLALLPVVVVTEQDSPQIINQVFRAGAIDFIQKNRLTADDLARSLRYAVERARNQNIRGQLARSQRLMSLGQVAASVAHEVNNPAAFVLTNLLTSQKLLTELQERLRRDGVLSSQTAHLLEELESLSQDNVDGVRRIAAIVSELRLFSHPKTETVEHVDLNDVVKIAIKLLSSKLQSAGKLALELSPLPLVAADRGRMVQVLVNLLDNSAIALKEAPHNPHTITVRTSQIGDWIQIQVTDTGAGMPPEVTAHAFEPFFTTKAAGLGTGLGLSLCAEYVHQHGGEIEIDSTQGEGTTVTVRIPMRTGLVPVSERPLHQQATKQSGYVVVIDDEPPLLRSLQRVLAGHHTVITFERARDALTALRSGLMASAIICDVNMPDLDGPSVYHELAEFNPKLARRIIFCTGGSFSETSHELLNQIGLQVLSKPVEPTALLLAIDQLLTATQRENSTSS